MTMEDMLDNYLDIFGFNPKEVEKILGGDDKYIRIDLEGGMSSVDNILFKEHLDYLSKNPPAGNE